MRTMITIRGMDPADKAWLRREARRVGVSMEEFARRLIRERRRRAEKRENLSEIFKRYFGPEHGVELPPRGRYGYRPVVFDDEGEA